MELSHIAIAVPQIEDVVAKLRELSLEIEEHHAVPTEKVDAYMIPVDVSKDFRIELLKPSAEDSPISKFLEKRPAGGLHQVSFSVKRLDDWLRKLESAGFTILKPGIRKAARGRALFIHPKDIAGVLVELEELSSGGT